MRMRTVIWVALKVCWLSMIPEWNQAKYTVICEACRDMELYSKYYSTTAILPMVTIMKPKAELDARSYTSNEANPQGSMEDSDEKEPMPLL